MERSYPLTVPLDLRWTLRLMTMWGATTWLKVDEGGAWFARRTREGPATVQLRHGGDHLLAEAWGDGAELLLDDVPELVGLEAASVLDFEAQHPLIERLQRKMPGYRQGRSGEAYHRLIAAGIAQKVTGANAKPALRKIAWTWGEAAPGPRDDLWLLPQPRELMRRDYAEFHQFGVERHRADLLTRIASRASALERAAKMPGPEARAHLMKLRGIGPWTSGVVCGGPLGDPDSVPIGDYHLPNIVAWNLAREPRADDARMMELLAPYAGFRGMVARMLKGAGGGAPRFGPKMSPIHMDR